MASPNPYANEKRAFATLVPYLPDELLHEFDNLLHDEKKRRGRPVVLTEQPLPTRDGPNEPPQATSSFSAEGSQSSQPDVNPSAGERPVLTSPVLDKAIMSLRKSIFWEAMSKLHGDGEDSDVEAEAEEGNGEENTASKNEMNA